LIRLSVIIITLNEAHAIERCLASLPEHDELIVLDSGSTDGTQSICERYGAKVVQTDWPGFGPQKNRALDLAKGLWVLSVDADEHFDPVLRAAVHACVNTPDSHSANQLDAAIVAFQFRRRSSFAGQYMRFGDWGRDKVLRLFRRGSARFSSLAVHESLQVQGQTALLPGFLLHESIRDWHDAMEKASLYARLSVDRMRARGPVGAVHGLLHGLWTFIRGFVIRLGCFDGYNGLRLALANAWGTYLRYRRAAGPNSMQSNLEK